MIRKAETAQQRRVREELMMPSPARIQQLAEEIRATWSPSQRARRAGHARRVQIVVVRTLDLVPARDNWET